MIRMMENMFLVRPGLGWVSSLGLCLATSPGLHVIKSACTACRSEVHIHTLSYTSETTTIIQPGEPPFQNRRGASTHSGEFKHALPQAGGPSILK